MRVEGSSRSNSHRLTLVDCRSRLHQSNGWPWHYFGLGSTAVITKTAVFRWIVHYLGRSTKQNWSGVVFLSSRWLCFFPATTVNTCLWSIRFLPRAGCHAIQTVQQSRALEKKQESVKNLQFHWRSFQLIPLHSSLLSLILHLSRFTKQSSRDPVLNALANQRKDSIFSVNEIQNKNPPSSGVCHFPAYSTGHMTFF